MTFFLRPISLLLWMLATAVPVAAAQTPPTAADSGAAAKAWIQRYVDAIGGEKVRQQQQNRLTKAEVEVPALGLSGTLEILQVHPRSVQQKISLTGGLEIRLVSDGTNAWTFIPGLGAQPMEGADRDQFLNDGALHRMLDLPTRFARVTEQGNADVQGTPCVVVVGTLADGKTERLYFGRADGLLRRWDREVVAQGDALPGEIYFDDYRDQGGWKTPFQMHQPKPEAASFTIKVTEVRINVPVPSAAFSRPE